MDPTFQWIICQNTPDIIKNLIWYTKTLTSRLISLKCVKMQVFTESTCFTWAQPFLFVVVSAAKCFLLPMLTVIFFQYISKNTFLPSFWYILFIFPWCTYGINEEDKQKIVKQNYQIFAPFSHWWRHAHLHAFICWFSHITLILRPPPGVCEAHLLQA